MEVVHSCSCQDPSCCWVRVQLAVRTVSTCPCTGLATQHIDNCECAQSPMSMIVLDDLERLLEYVPIGAALL